MGKRCFFIGHRDAPEAIYPQLLAEVERHIAELGVTEFIVGHYGRFDRLAAKAVIAAKQRHPNILLLLLLPYHPAEQSIEIPVGFDYTYYPPGMEKVPRRLAIIQANRHVVDHIDYLIAYAWHPASNARELAKYAAVRRQNAKVTVVNIYSK